MRLLRVAEVAEILQISPRTVWRMVEDGRLPSVRVGGSVRFRTEDVEAFIREGARATIAGAIRRSVAHLERGEPAP